MASVTYDGRSFMLDGRRIWLVSGSIPYFRLPRASWADRIHAAKLAGLNTVDVPIAWHRHEPRPGQFNFEGENDLRHFVELVGRAGMMCILRVGPYIGQDLDMGGLPPWLTAIPNIALRTNSGPFLEACSRYISAVADEIRDLQITAPGAGGPIVLVQNESSWTCGNDDLATAYLGELIRYLREGGINVPLINANNLWQGVEGEIDGWCGSEQMISTLRQLTTVRPDQPRFVIDFKVGSTLTWGSEPKPLPEPLVVQRRMAEALAGGGQFNIQPFAGGTNFGFSAGRDPDGSDGFATASMDYGAPLDEAGRPTELYRLARRVCHFATHFGRVLSNLDSSYQPVMLDVAQHVGSRAPRSGKGPGVNAGYVVAHSHGGQGGIAFVFRDQHAEAPSTATLLLADGSNLIVPMGKQHVAWCLIDVHVGGRARIDYCGFCAFGIVGKAFVCFGPAGVRGVISVNGSPLELEAPKGKKPLVLEHEGLHIVLCNEDQIDRAYLSEQGVFVGATGLTPAGEPLVDDPAEQRQVMLIDPEGNTKSANAKVRPVPKTPPKATLSAMAAADMAEYVSGESARYATITGPADLVALGCPTGYGWYRVTFKSGSARKVRIAAPHASDRLHLYVDGEHTGTLGVGPGAEEHATLSLKKGAHSLVVLAENFGRVSGGSQLGEPKGLYGHLYAVQPVKGIKSKVVTAEPIDLLKFKSPLWEIRVADATAPDRLTLTFAHRKASPVIVRVRNARARGVLVVNGTPTRFLERSANISVLLEAPLLAKGNNTVQVAFIDDGLGDPVETALKNVEVTVEECLDTVTAKAEWAFAKWEPPAGAAYKPAKGAAAPKGPAWWRGAFTANTADVPLAIDLTGMTKGQIYIDDQHLGRYFVSTGKGTVGPQTRHIIPAAWIRPGEAQEIVLFDEHGGNPAKCKLVYLEGSPVIRT